MPSHTPRWVTATTFSHVSSVSLVTVHTAVRPFLWDDHVADEPSLALGQLRDFVVDLEPDGHYRSPDARECAASLTEFNSVVQVAGPRRPPRLPPVDHLPGNIRSTAVVTASGSTTHWESRT
jgi:hypothetical protein